MFTPVGGAEPDFDVIVQGNLTVSGQEILLPTGDIILTSGSVKGNDAEFTGPLSCTNLTASGLITGDRATITGELQCGSLIAEGGLQITELACDIAEVFGAINAGGIVTAGGLIAGNSVITGNLVVEGALSVTSGLPIPEAICGIVSIGPSGAGLVASVSYPSITATGVVLITPQSASAQIFNGVLYSVNVLPGVGFQIYASAGFGGGLGMAWVIARL